MKEKSACLFGSLPINFFTSYGRKVVTKTGIPIFFNIEYDSKNDLYFVDSKELGLFASSNKKESLIRELRQNLEFVWTGIALEKNANLSPDSIEVKKNLLRIFREEI